MRLILIGQAAFAEKVLDGLRSRGHDVAAVYCPPDRPGAKPDPVKALANSLGISVHQHKSLRGDEVQREFTDLRADLGVLAYVTQIVPQNVIEIPRLGCICFHPSLLPRYRGGSAIPWQIIKGETKTGATVFWTDPGIDTGPILLQREASIAPDDSAASLYYNTIFPLGVDLVLDSVDLAATGNAPRVPQDHSIATYDPLCSDEHAAICFSQPAATVHNLIRGCDPSPGAYVDTGGRRLRLFDSKLLDDGTNAPGVVQDVSAAGVVIGTASGCVRIGKLRIDADAKSLAADAAVSLGWSRGSRING